MGLAMMSGLVALAILAVFIAAIRVSYAIEKTTKPRARFPRYTNIWATLFGLGVDRDDLVTRALVARLQRLMAVVGLLFVVLIAISVMGR